MSKRTLTISEFEKKQQAGGAQPSPSGFLEQLEQSSEQAPKRVGGWMSWIEEHLPAGQVVNVADLERLSKEFHSHFKAQALDETPTRDQVLEEGAKWVIDRTIDSYALGMIRNEIRACQPDQYSQRWLRSLENKIVGDMQTVVDVVRDYHQNVHTLEFLTMMPNDPQAKTLNINNRMTSHPEEIIHYQYIKPSDKLYRPSKSRANPQVLSILNAMDMSIDAINIERNRIAEDLPPWSPPKTSKPSP